MPKWSMAPPARSIPAGDGRLTAEVRGEIEKEGNTIVVRRIHVTYLLKVKKAQQDTAIRAHGFHADHCPLARTIKSCVDISTELKMED